jgi:hypothetical protein
MFQPDSDQAAGVREWSFVVPDLIPDPTLDERFLELRRCVDLETARARREAIAEVARAVSRLRSAATQFDWSAAVAESEKQFEGDAEALELIATLAALTAPTSNESAREASARRFAKVKIAEIQLYQAPAVKAGRASHDLYGALKPHIDAARQAFEERYLGNGHPTADYLHTEFVRTLANDDATLLGPGYPGPLA